MEQVLFCCGSKKNWDFSPYCDCVEREILSSCLTLKLILCVLKSLAHFFCFSSSSITLNDRCLLSCLLLRPHSAWLKASCRAPAFQVSCLHSSDNWFSACDLLNADHLIKVVSTCICSENIQKKKISESSSNKARSTKDKVKWPTNEQMRRWCHFAYDSVRLWCVKPSRHFRNKNGEWIFSAECLLSI